MHELEIGNSRISIREINPPRVDRHFIRFSSKLDLRFLDDKECSIPRHFPYQSLNLDPYRILNIQLYQQLRNAFYCFRWVVAGIDHCLRSWNWFDELGVHQAWINRRRVWLGVRSVFYTCFLTGRVNLAQLQRKRKKLIKFFLRYHLDIYY